MSRHGSPVHIGIDEEDLPLQPRDLIRQGKVRLALAKGGRYETLMGLSGLGDLILTCGSAKSRNMSFGIAIGQGKSKEEILSAHNAKYCRLRRTAKQHLYTLGSDKNRNNTT